LMKQVRKVKKCIESLFVQVNTGNARAKKPKKDLPGGGMWGGVGPGLSA